MPARRRDRRPWESELTAGAGPYPRPEGSMVDPLRRLGTRSLDRNASRGTNVSSTDRRVRAAEGRCGVDQRRRRRGRGVPICGRRFGAVL